jgi:hypothetical protein
MFFPVVRSSALLGEGSKQLGSRHLPSHDHYHCWSSLTNLALIRTFSHSLPLSLGLISYLEGRDLHVCGGDDGGDSATAAAADDAAARSDRGLAAAAAGEEEEVFFSSTAMVATAACMRNQVGVFWQGDVNWCL